MSPPRGDRTRAREPDGVVGVVAELGVMGGEAGVEEVVLYCLRIENWHFIRRVLGRPFPQRNDNVAFNPRRPLGFFLGQLALCDSIGPIAKLFERRNIHHRVPVDRRVVVRCGGGTRRRHGREIQLLAWLDALPGRSPRLRLRGRAPRYRSRPYRSPRRALERWQAAQKALRAQKV